MSVSFGNGVTVITSFWTAFLAIVQTKSLSIQYNDDGIITTVFAFDGPALAYQAVMYDNASGGTVPYAIINAGYSQAQNNSDLSTFQTTYRSSCNQNADAIIATGSLGALNATVQIAMGGFQTVGVQIAAGTFIGSIIPEVSFDNGTTWTQVYFVAVGSGNKSAAYVFGSANFAQALTIIVAGGSGLVRVRASSYTSGTCNITMRSSGIEDPTLLLYTAETGTPPPPNSAVVAGVSSGGPLNDGIGVIRAMRTDRLGNSRVGFDTLLAHDSIEGTTVNSWLWAQSTTTMTIAQTTGVLTINNSGTLTTTTDAIITTNRQFPLYNHGVLNFAMRANIIYGSTNAIIELGIGAPSGTTAIINNGAFFRINGSSVSIVTSFNGTEAVTGVSAPSTSEYYMFLIYIQDDFVHFIIEDSSGIPIVDTLAFPNISGFSNVPGISATSHLPAFARVHNSAAVAAAAKLLIGSYDTYQLDLNMNKPWSHQMAATGRSANINPTTFAQATQLAAGAAPTTSTPASTTVAYATLGGEFVLNGTASSENLLGVFGYQNPSPYSLHITDILLPQPFITTALGATVNIQEWCLMVASSNNPSTATGQRYTLGMFSAAASAVAGTVMNGLPLDFDLGTPIVVLPGLFLLVLVKVISGSAAGVYRGSISINGYYE